MKDAWKRIRDFWGKFSKKTRILILVVAIGVVGGAVVLASVLNHKEYVTLFSGINEDETTEILGRLQEMGVEYTSSGTGDILVPASVADSTRAQLAYDGYPKSGFTYDIFIEHAGGMTTDMEKRAYKLYELQEHIGATIRLFDGVKDAKVIIALQDSGRYVLDDSNKSSTASVTVIMEDGGSPTAKQAEGIQRLVAHSVPDMEMDAVTVLDGNGVEVTPSNGDTSGDAAEEIAQLIENEISKKVTYVLEPFFGPNNVRVAAKCRVNMEKLIRESITYSTPEKIDEDDKTGIISNEEWSREAAGDGTRVGGIVGTEVNSEIPQYTANAEEVDNGYYSLSGARDYLVNQLKEQGELAPGMLEDLTVAVSINSESFPQGLDRDRIVELVAKASGITAENRADKITVVNAPFYVETPPAPPVEPVVGTPIETVMKYWPWLLIGGVTFLVLLLLLLFLLMRRKKKKKLAAEAAARAAAEAALLAEQEALLQEAGQNDQQAKNDILNIKNERSRELRESVREFADANPEISAQMLKNWLHGGEDNGGGK